MKRPSFQFYPADWLRDTALRSCSTGARGLWIDMICWMHEGSPYGHLKVGEKVILPDNLARMVGETLEVVEGWIKELKQAGVFEYAEDGSICSRRMIRDEHLRNTRAAGGKLGGNPALKVNLRDNLDVNMKVVLEDKQIPTPSSSSSSSTSIKRERSPSGSRLTATELDPEWKKFCLSERPELDPALVFDNFCNYWKALPGAKGNKTDWFLTWKNWVRRETSIPSNKAKEVINLRRGL